jgi:hypothetical protein
VDVESIHAVQNALGSINNMLAEKFGIVHTTIQFECGEHDGTEPLLCDFRHIEEEAHEHDHDHEDHEHSPGQ